MYRFLLRPKWILFHIVVVASSIGMLGLAQWQWERHNERNAFVAKVTARELAEPVELVPLLANTAAGAIEYSRVTASGTYIADEQFTEILQVRDGVNGVNVLTPLQIDGGPIVIVNRGFIAEGQAVPDPPAGTLRVGGMARTTEVRQTGQLTDDNDGAQSNELRRVDLDLISKRLAVPLAPVYLDFIASDPPSPLPPAPPLAPDLSGGPPHVSYTIQWITFSMAVLAGWVFAVRRSVRTRRREANTTVAVAATQAGADVVIPPDVDALISAERPTPPSA